MNQLFFYCFSYIILLVKDGYKDGLCTPSGKPTCPLYNKKSENRKGERLEKVEQAAIFGKRYRKSRKNRVDFTNIFRLFLRIKTEKC